VGLGEGVSQRRTMLRANWECCIGSWCLGMGHSQGLDLQTAHQIRQFLIIISFPMRMAEAQLELETSPIPSRIEAILSGNWDQSAEEVSDRLAMPATLSSSPRSLTTLFINHIKRIACNGSALGHWAYPHHHHNHPPWLPSL
jgi:hypothetical protein